MLPELYRMQPVTPCCSSRLLIRCHSNMGPLLRSRTAFRELDCTRFHRFGVLLSMTRIRSGEIPHCLAASSVLSSNSGEQSNTFASPSLTCLTNSPTVKAVDAPLKMPPAHIVE